MRNGVINGATWTVGKVNSALSFNGSNSSVVTAPISLANTFSVSAWINSKGAQSGYARILETQYTTGLYLGIDSTGTKFKFIVNGGSGATGKCGMAYGCAEGGKVATGWHLVTGVFDGAIARLYVDGVEVATETFTAPANTNYPLYMGRLYSSNGSGWNGAMDEVRLYNKVLSATEVASLFASPGAQ